MELFISTTSTLLLTYWNNATNTLHNAITPSSPHISLYEVMVSEAVARVCSLKKVFLKFGKIHKKTPVLESVF